MCIYCKSEIELESIEFQNNNEEDSIIYECQNDCGKIKISIKEYLQKFKFNTFMNEKCNKCGKTQIKEYIKNKNIFNYCIDCKEILCNQCSICRHNKSIKINEINSKCSLHYNNDFICYCFSDKKNLCNECIKNGSHLEHYKIYMEEISPIKIDGKNEELEIFENINKY